MYKELTHQSNNIVIIGMAVALFLVAIIKLPVGLGHVRDFYLGLSQLGILVVFAVVLFSINKWAGMFLILAIVSSSVPMLTFESQRALKCVVYGLGWYYFVSVYANKKLMMDVMCVIAFAHLMATCVQFFHIPSIFTGRVVGLTANPNEGAAMFALCFPAFLRYGRVRYLPMIPVGLFMMGSFGGVLAVVAGITFYLCVVGYYVYVIPAIVLMLLFIVFVHKPTAGMRLDAWENSFKMYLHTWKFGYGLGHWETISRELVKANIHLSHETTRAWPRLHNTFLNALVEMGIGFAVIVSGYLIDTARKFTKDNLIPFTALIVILVCCSTNSMFRINAINGMLAITWLAILQRGVTR